MKRINSKNSKHGVNLPSPLLLPSQYSSINEYEKNINNILESHGFIFVLHIRCLNLYLLSPNIYKKSLSILYSIKPSFVIMAQPNLRILRETEVYRADTPGKSLRLYFLRYDESSEQYSYISDLQTESNAFDKLINEKKSLILPTGKMYIFSIL